MAACGLISAIDWSLPTASIKSSKEYPVDLVILFISSSVLLDIWPKSFLFDASYPALAAVLVNLKRPWNAGFATVPIMASSIPEVNLSSISPSDVPTPYM